MARREITLGMKGPHNCNQLGWPALLSIASKLTQPRRPLWVDSVEKRIAEKSTCTRVHIYQKFSPKSRLIQQSFTKIDTIETSQNKYRLFQHYRSTADSYLHYNA